MAPPRWLTRSVMCGPRTRLLPRTWTDTMRTHTISAALLVLLLLPAVSRAQNRASGFTVGIAPSFQALRGADYQGIAGGIGIDVNGHYNFGPSAIGLGYRRHGHGVNVGALGVNVQGVAARIVIDGLYGEYRHTFSIDDAAPVTLYLPVYVGILKQSLETSAQGLRVVLQADGFALGSGMGAYYELSPAVELTGELSLGAMTYGDFAGLEEFGSSSTSGLEFVLKVGARLRLDRLLSGSTVAEHVSGSVR